MLQQRAERKVLECSNKRRMCLYQLEEEKFLAISHIRALEEQLAAKTYEHVPEESTVNVFAKEHSTLRTHLALHQSF